MAEIKLAIGYKPVDDLIIFDSLIKVEVSDFTFLNIYYLIKSRDIAKVKKQVITCLEELETKGNVSYVETLAPLNYCFEKYDAMQELHQYDLDFIKQIIVELHFLVAKLPKISWVKENVPTVDVKSKDLYIRHGNVELRVLESYLREKYNLLDALDSVSERINLVDFIYRDMVQDQARWLSAGDVQYNIKALMTNAGFYFSNNSKIDASLDLELWCEYSLKGLSYGNIFLYPPAYPWFLNIWKFLSDTTPNFKYKPCDFCSIPLDSYI